MRKRILICIVLLAGLTSCMLADNYYDQKRIPEIPLDQKVQESIKSYIKENINSTDQYLNYDFGKLSIHVPAELQELEKWKSRRGNVNYDQKHVNQQVSRYDSLVSNYNLQRTLKMNHVFSVRHSEDSLGELSKVEFHLDENFKVDNMIPSYNLQLTEDQEEVFANFFYETPLLKGYTYDQSRSLNKKFYAHFKDRLAELPTIKEREDFLNHAIMVWGEVIKNRAFNQQDIAELMAQNYLKHPSQNILSYQSVRFSELYEIRSEEVLEGYYFFHAFKFDVDTLTDSMNVYIKFSPYYEVDAVFETKETDF